MQRKVRIRRPIGYQGARPKYDHPAPCALSPLPYERLGLVFGTLVVVLETGVVPEICLVDCPGSAGTGDKRARHMEQVRHPRPGVREFQYPPGRVDVRAAEHGDI